MSDNAPQVTTPEGQGVLLWAMQQQLSRMEKHQQEHNQRVENVISTLATTRYVDDKFDSLNAKLESNKPGTIMRNVAAFLGLLTLIGAVVGLMFEVVRSYDHRPAVVSK